MDKQKLLRIIVKDLEELKFLSEEISTSGDDSILIIDLALSKAKLLCQEIEVLKEISAPTKKNHENDELEEQENEEIYIADPELEILNFSDPEFSEEEQAEEEFVENEGKTDKEPELDELVEDDSQSINEEEPEEVFENTQEEESEKTFAVSEESEEDEEEVNEEDENLEEDIIEEDLEEDDEEDENEMEDEDDSEITMSLDEEDALSKAEFREITIDDDDEIETIQFPTQATSDHRPVMHEIPKPEEPAPEKMVIGETFSKERSINDALGENSGESKLTIGPISNLRAAIGLNDRFLFIREIFDNNAEKYNMVIENLDKLETIQQAVEYLKANLTLQKNDTSMKFVELLKRRFTK